MNKFKVGDMVRVVGGAYSSYTPGSPYNLPRRAGEVKESWDGYIKVDFDGQISPPVDPRSFILDSPMPTIRTVTITRQEIAPGQYGIVSVTKEGKIIIQPAVYTNEQLREAAHILSQIAEALEDETTK